MYINFKSKYKKIFWLLIGFCVACMFTSKAKAWSDISEFTLPSGITQDTHNIIIEYSTWRYGTGYFAWIIPKSENKYFTHYGSYSYPTINSSTINSNGGIRVTSYPGSSTPLTGQCRWTWGTNPQSTPICDSTSGQQLPTPSTLQYTNTTIYSASNSSGVWFEPYVINFYLNGATMWTNGNNSVPYSLLDFENSFESSSSAIDFINNHNLTNGDLVFDGWFYDADFTQPFSTNDTISHNISLYAKFSNSLPDYLSGYTEITLEPGERYVMFSSSTITSGSVYIPISDFNNYGSRISYFDKDIDTQPYTSYIQDFTITSDGLYAKQNFDLSSFVGSDFIMFSKYIYLEGEDNFSSSIWVPTAMYSSIVEVSPNNTGGSDFDFSYVDTNGDLQAEIISTSDLSESSPLVSDLFTNFTTKDFGLSSIITAPIPLLQSLNSASCTNIQLPLGVFGGRHDEKITLPCMTQIYTSAFGDLFNLYQTITTGLIAYWVGLAYFNKIKQLKDPYNDKIEVVNL